MELAQFISTKSVSLSLLLTDFSFFSYSKWFLGLCLGFIRPSLISPFHKHESCSGPGTGLGIGHWFLTVHSRTSTIPASISTTSLSPTQAFPGDQPCVLNSSWIPDLRRWNSDMTKGTEHHLPEPAPSGSWLFDFYYLPQHFLSHWKWKSDVVSLTDRLVSYPVTIHV